MNNTQGGDLHEIRPALILALIVISSLLLANLLAQQPWLSRWGL